MLEKQFFVSTFNKCKYFFIIWTLLISFVYWDNIVYYPNSIIEHYSLKSLYSSFDYIHDSVREREALEYAKSNGRYNEAKFYIEHMGFEFLKPIPNWWKFFVLIVRPFVVIFFVFYVTGWR